MKLALSLVAIASARAEYSSRECAAPLLAAGVSSHYAEAIGHSIHSLTVQDLKKFHPRATAENGIPTVARHLERDHGIQKNAPDVPLPSGFGTEEMQVVDLLLSHLGEGDDGLGHVWSPLERVVHMFHMRDLYARIKSQTPAVLANVTQGTLDAVCPCLVDTENNGVGDKVKWIAGEYQKWMPISLHEWGSKIPKLTDKDTWQIWKKRLTFYYGKGDVRDAALYIHCALRKFDA